MEKKNVQTNSPSIVSIFSGCGGLDLGFHMEGFETVWANDFAEWAVASFRENLGEVIHYGDITKINPSILSLAETVWGAESRFLVYRQYIIVVWQKIRKQTLCGNTQECSVMIATLI